MKRSIGIYIIMGACLLLLIAFRGYIYRAYDRLTRQDKEIKFTYKNEYFLDYKYQYIKNVDDIKLENKNDVLNLYYTIINTGLDNFDFYCPDDYLTCIDDVIEITYNQEYLSDINGFVHPFNSFDTIETTYDTMNKVHVSIVKTYTDKEIEEINEKVDEIIENVVTDDVHQKELIKTIHDYIIENSKYDVQRADHNVIKYASNTAYGVLFEGYGICSGYADTMSIFLNRYNIPNFKIASENHVWNAVKLDGEWYHLDLTWDDPITDNDKDVVLHDYFLITSDELKNLDKTQHGYDENVYMEMKDTKVDKTL